MGLLNSPAELLHESFALYFKETLGLQQVGFRPALRFGSGGLSGRNDCLVLGRGLGP